MTITKTVKVHSFLSTRSSAQKQTWIIVFSFKIHTCDCLCMCVGLRGVMFSPDRHFAVSDVSVSEMRCVERTPTYNVLCVHF